MARLIWAVWAVVLVGSTAFGDGFECHSDEFQLNIKVYHHIHRELGTRRAAVMTVSSTEEQSPNRTIAVFRDATLSSKSLKYTAKVDLRYRESSRGGELIASTKLNQLSTIELIVDFVYGKRLAAGDEVDAIAYLNKRDGEQISFEMICARYLKN